MRHDGSRTLIVYTKDDEILDIRVSPSEDVERHLAMCKKISDTIKARAISLDLVADFLGRK